MDSIEKQVQQLKEREHNLSQSLNAFQLEIEAAEKRLGELSLLVAKNEKEVELGKKAVVAIHDQAEEEQKRVDQLRAETGVLVAKKEAGEIRLKEVEVALVTTKGELREMSRILTEENNILKNRFEKEIAALEQKIRTTRNEAEETNNKVMVERTSLDAVRNEIKALVEHKQDVVEDVQKKENEILRLRGELVSLQDRSLLENKKIIQLKEELAEFVGQKNSVVAELESLAAEQEIAQKEVDALVKDKINFVEKQRALEQKEQQIRELYKKAGVNFPD